VSATDYIELHASSAFSFLRGASFPEQLVETALQLDFPALAVCDRNGLYGAPRFCAAAREKGLRPIVGCELTMSDGSVLPVLVENRRGYRNLCALLSQTHLRSVKGECAVDWDELAEHAAGLVALTGDEEGPLRRALAASAQTTPPRPSPRKMASPSPPVDPQTVLPKLISIFGDKNVFVELQRRLLRGENRGLAQLIALARRHHLPLLASNGVRHATPAGRQVMDLFTCLREHTHLDEAGLLLSPNAERHLKSGAEMCALFADLPEAIINTARLAERLTFSLENLGYEFPCYETPDQSSMEDFLRRITFEGARWRYGNSLPEKVRQQLEHELALINRLNFPGYFLIVWDIVRFCREQDVMVQGRGSAANSAVCFCLGITAVDAVQHELLFERFLSEGRRSWPDIDLDLPSGDRRESVIQEVYRRYGRHGAAMTANVISYRGRSDAREIGKALNFPNDLIDRFSALFASGDYPHTLPLENQLRQAGIPPAHPRTAPFLALYKAIYGLPRHLGQHSGGMIICKDKLSSMVPLENASMPGRSVAQWDKDDCDNLGIIKVDLLGLGMMSVLQETIELCARHGDPVDLAQIPKDDPATYEMMSRADTIGVFQIESRAQMATLPRMQPRTFYDVAIEVAIIRPGPIQGGLMNPYLARRSGKQPVTYLDPRLEPVLKRTLGVPLFQEQILQIAMIIADFNGSEAEELRRAVSYHRSQERMQKVVAKLRTRMAAKGLTPEKMEQILQAIQSFALYGFPESHAISFALLAYASAWLKVHRAPEFFASLLNNQPMGFYSPATLVKDATRHGVRIRPVCLVHSQWPCTIETDRSIRLGFCIARGVGAARVQQLLAHRPYRSLEDVKARSGLHKDELRVLAEIGAFNALADHRRDALWQIERELLPADDLFTLGSARSAASTATPLLPMNVHERLQADYRGTGLTIGPHAMALVREQLPDIWRAIDLEQVRHGTRVRVAGNVICRQRPGTAKGFVFLSLEDESGIANVIITPPFFEAHRLVLVHEPFLIIEGIAQKHEGVLHIRADRIEPLIADRLAAAESHDFH
jgi:error-prone DNA polymerase